MRWRFFTRRLAMLLASPLVASLVLFAALYLTPSRNRVQADLLTVAVYH
jgi:hypothetical protein